MNRAGHPQHGRTPNRTRNPSTSEKATTSCRPASPLTTRPDSCAVVPLRTACATPAVASGARRRSPQRPSAASHTSTGRCCPPPIPAIPAMELTAAERRPDRRCWLAPSPRPDVQCHRPEDLDPVVGADRRLPSTVLAVDEPLAVPLEEPALFEGPAATAGWANFSQRKTSWTVAPPTAWSDALPARAFRAHVASRVPPVAFRGSWRRAELSAVV
jgi:hypothetical protein